MILNVVTNIGKVLKNDGASLVSFFFFNFVNFDAIELPRKTKIFVCKFFP